ncbi:TonB-dependent receptor plug domain-containing protein [Pseudomaricurvus hydrocarbonicus]|nr:TonB-dependent receptor [Aestuariicella hydrocarbonica]
MTVTNRQCTTSSRRLLSRRQKKSVRQPWLNFKRLAGLMLPLPLAISAAIAIAQENDSEEATLIEEVITIGTRTKGRTSEDMPVPVDVLNAEALDHTGQTEVGRMLQSLAPSFNFSSSSISDGTDALRPATLRGLGPDQTLVLINGKRRHQASLIHINTSVGRGTAGVDMNAIPAASIKRIEVLRDGAAAQYGSDAIAGVINIVLKDDNEAGRVSTSYGEYSEGDGETVNLDFNKGFELGDVGFINATLNYRDRGRTNRAGLQGACAYGGCVDTDGNGFAEIGDPREATFDREAFRIGDADSEQYAFVLNGAVGIGVGEVYGFVTYSERENQSGAFYRNPESGYDAALDDGDNVIPNGFLPLINSQIDDMSFDVGYRTEFSSGTTFDVSYTYGKNEIDYTTSNSINYSYVNFLNFGQGLSDADIRSTIPRKADAYGLELELETFNIAMTHAIGELGIAAGFEYRTDTYKITPGDPYAYDDFDTTNGISNYPQDAGGGIQGFPGISPVSSVDEDRNIVSFYVDLEYQLTDAFLVSGAVRYDDYQDFGDTTNYKLAANWELSDYIRLRAAVSTGFRAPSMQQQYFNNIGTQFVDDPSNPGGPQIPVQVGTFRNDSDLARAIGIPQLKEEESTNWSVGVIFTPLEQLSITLDYYSIDIDDRIVISNRLASDDDPTGTLGDALSSVGAGAAQFFLNGANTETRGFDLVATYQGIELVGGLLDLTLAANKTETEVTDIFTSAGGDLSQLAPEVVFSDQDISIIEEWQPEDRISLTGLYLLGNWSVNLAFNRYGEYTVEDGGRQTFDAQWLTDLNVAYSFGNGLNLSLGGNNIFDEYPDKNEIGNSRGGALEDAVGGNVIVNSPGVFTYSRRSAPFGFNGAYWYGRITYDF